MSIMRSAPKVVFNRTVPEGEGIASPIMLACFPVGWVFIADNTVWACSGFTTRTNFPSFARYRGSNPKISQIPLTSSRMGIACSWRRIPMLEVWANSFHLAWREFRDKC
jgi:hypothetical protein